MANISRRRVLQPAEEPRPVRNHLDCPAALFSRGPRHVPGDVERCEHGVIIEFRAQHRYYTKPEVRELTPLRHPFLWSRARRALLAEAAALAVEPDGDPEV